jgi:hypothetical protein
MESTFPSLFPWPKGRGREPLSSLMLTGREHLLQCSLVASCYFLRGVVENLGVSRPGACASRRQHFVGGLNHAGQNVLQERICQGKLRVYQSEQRLYLLRHICKGGRNAGLKLLVASVWSPRLTSFSHAVRIKACSERKPRSWAAQRTRSRNSWLGKSKFRSILCFCMFGSQFFRVAHLWHNSLESPHPLSV